MIKPIKTILFATNLNENCKPAFEMAASIATRYQATIVFLHVLEKLPTVIEGRLKSLVGEKAWHEMAQYHADSARDVIIAKRSSNKLIMNALEHFCSNAGIDNDSCGYNTVEILVADGEVVEEIINHSNEYNADLIVMRARVGFLSDNRIGHILKSVIKKAHCSVMIVPNMKNEND